MESGHEIKHIVMADDDSDGAILFERILKETYPGVRLSVVQDGEQLLHFLRHQRVDILFLDLKMPCKTGYECLREIKNNPVLASIPIVVYSGSANKSDIDESFLCKADFYLVKPFRCDDLKTALKSILSIDWNEREEPQRYYFMNNQLLPYPAVGGK